MPDALVGHSGFVGGVVGRAHAFEGLYDSGNIEAIRGRAYDLVVCAGAPAEKWRANRDPEADLANLRRLMRSLAELEAGHLVLVSTVDVYPEPIGVDEDTPIDEAAGTPYGRHRYMLERFCESRFESSIIRLPALFGPGLKKNAIFDLIHGNRTELINPDSIFQFYSLSRLWTDIGRVREAGLNLMNLATEPMSMRDVAREAFGIDFENPGAPPAVSYDFRSRHAELLGGRDGYVYDRGQVISELTEFVRTERLRTGAAAGEVG